jgi:hypothetical protein
MRVNWMLNGQIQKEGTVMFKLQLFLIVLIFILGMVSVFRTDKKAEQCSSIGGVLVESSTGDYVCVDKNKQPSNKR